MFAFACLFVTGETDFGHLAELREVVCDSCRGEGGKRGQKRERERDGRNGGDHWRDECGN